MLAKRLAKVNTIIAPLIFFVIVDMTEDLCGHYTTRRSVLLEEGGILEKSWKSAKNALKKVGKVSKFRPKMVGKVPKLCYTICMVYRQAAEALKNWQKSDSKAILVTGARQVGKTYIIDKFLEENCESVFRLNLLENESAAVLFNSSKSAKELLMRLSLAAPDQKLVPHKTVIFLDEIQVCKEIVTTIKFLVEEGSYRYILSGSLLGVELSDINSAPVGYLRILKMFPMNLKEFFIANGVNDDVFEHLENAFKNKSPVDSFVHDKLMELFKLYLIVGGMPKAVQTYIDTNNIQNVIAEHNYIRELYKVDISKYDKEKKLYLNEIFDLIPSELNQQNKRFILKNLNEKKRFSRMENSFVWLKDAGVALPTFCADEPKYPLKLSKNTNLFKLFLCDTGMLCSMFMNNVQIKILNGEQDINFGSVYENFVAQELCANGIELYYYKNKKQGEVDFVIELAEKVLPIEVKSGKDYKIHNALNNILASPEYEIQNAYILSNSNLSAHGKKIYLPMYMTMFLKNSAPDIGVYKVDVSGLSGWKERN